MKNKILYAITAFTIALSHNVYTMDSDEKLAEATAKGIINNLIASTQNDEDNELQELFEKEFSDLKKQMTMEPVEKFKLHEGVKASDYFRPTSNILGLSIYSTLDFENCTINQMMAAQKESEKSLNQEDQKKYDELLNEQRQLSKKKEANGKLSLEDQKKYDENFETITHLWDNRTSETERKRNKYLETYRTLSDEKDNITLDLQEMEDCYNDTIINTDNLENPIYLNENYLFSMLKNQKIYLSEVNTWLLEREKQIKHRSEIPKHEKQKKSYNEQINLYRERKKNLKLLTKKEFDKVLSNIVGTLDDFDYYTQTIALHRKKQPAIKKELDKLNKKLNTINVKINNLKNQNIEFVKKEYKPVPMFAHKNKTAFMIERSLLEEKETQKYPVMPPLYNLEEFEKDTQFRYDHETKTKKSWSQITEDEEYEQMTGKKRKRDDLDKLGNQAKKRKTYL